MLTKKIRTEYMKKFRDPKWETFCKCYEDSLKYRLTRRVMEHAHKPWGCYEGWDSGSDSSGRSTPKLRNTVSLLLNRSPTSDSNNESSSGPKETSELENGGAELETRKVVPPLGLVMENGLNESDEGPVNKIPMNKLTRSQTENGLANKGCTSSEEEPVRTSHKHRRCHRGPRSEPGSRDVPCDDKPTAVRKPPRAKSQPPPASTKYNRPPSAPPASTKYTRPPSARHNWTERHVETSARRTLHEGRTPDVCVQTRRESDKRASNPERRRARSADLEKTQRSQLAVVDDRWTTEYMRCFSARLR